LYNFIVNIHSNVREL